MNYYLTSKTNVSDRVTMRFLDELCRATTPPTPKAALSREELVSQIGLILNAARILLPEVRVLATMLDASSPAVAQLAHYRYLFPYLEEYNPLELYGLVSAANVLGNETNDDAAARAAEIDTINWNLNLCDAYSVLHSSTWPALWGSPVFGTSMRLPLIANTHVDTSQLTARTYMNEAGAVVGAVKTLSTLASDVGILSSVASTVLSVVPIVGTIVSIVSDIFGMASGTPQLPAGYEFWAMITNGTMGRIDATVTDRFVTQLVDATEVPSDTKLAAILGLLSGFGQDVLTDPSPVVAAASVSENQGTDPATVATTAPPLGTNWIAAMTTSQSARSSTPTLYVPGISPSRSGLSGPPVQLSSTLLGYVNNANALVSSTLQGPGYGDMVERAIGWVRTMQVLTGRDYTPALRLLMQRNPNFKTWIDQRSEAIGYVQNYIPPIRQSTLPPGALTDEDALRDALAKFKPAAGAYGDAMLMRGVAERKTPGYHSMHPRRRKVFDSSCTSCMDAPPQEQDYSFWSSSRIPDGEFYRSGLVSASVGDLPPGVHGETQIDELPFRITIAANQHPSRAQIALSHEMAHVMDTTYKLGLTHEQVHDMGVFLTTEALPALASIKSK